MTLWSSADLLQQFNELLRRPSSDEITDTTKYQRLSRAQAAVLEMIAAITPGMLLSPPTALTTADNKVFTFGNDANGYPVQPLGHIGVFPTLNAIPDAPWLEGIDYLDEGTQIRIPNNRVWANPLYSQWIAAPADIDGSGTKEPSLKQGPMRRLIVLFAALTFAEEGGTRPELVQTLSVAFDRAWRREMLALRTAYRPGAIKDPARWYRSSPDLR